MGYSAVVQIVLVIVAGIIGWTYIKPQVTEIGVLQDEVAEYKNTVDKAKQYNDQLNQLLTRANSIPQTNIKSLETYLPQQLDPVTVARDIQTIALNSQVVLQGVSFTTVDEESGRIATENDLYGAEGALGEEARAKIVPRTFEFEVSGPYADLKRFLEGLERNSYPLKVVSMNLSTGENDGEIQNSDFYTFALTIETYGFTS